MTTARKELTHMCKAMWLVPQFCWRFDKRTLIIHGPKDKYVRTAEKGETFESMAREAVEQMKRGWQEATEVIHANRKGLTREDIEAMVKENANEN